MSAACSSSVCGTSGATMDVGHPFFPARGQTISFGIRADIGSMCSRLHCSYNVSKPDFQHQVGRPCATAGTPCAPK